MIFVGAIFVVCILSFLLWKLPFFRNTGLQTWQVLSAFYLKLIVAAAFFAVYNYYPAYQNQSDSLAFYRSAAQFSNIANENFGDYLRASFHLSVKSPEIEEKLQEIPFWNRPFETALPNDTRQTLILYSFLYNISLGSQIIMLIIANFLAFLGLFALFRAFLLLNNSNSHDKKSYSRTLLFAFVACFCIPSTLFWSSGLMKETWLLLFMGFTIYSAVQFFKTSKIRFAIFTIIWAIALIHIKLYIATFLLPLLLVYAFRKKYPSIRAFVFYGIIAVSCIIVAIFAHYFLHFNIIETLAQQRNTFIRMLEFQNHSSIILNHFDASFWDFCVQLFVGFFNVLLQPNIFCTQNAFVFFAGLENTIIAILLVFSIFSWIKNRYSSSDYIFLTIVFLVGVFAIIGFTTPNMGALMRYKSPLLPFLLIIIFHFLPQRKDFEQKSLREFLCKRCNNQQ